ncbi:MAG: FtsX-like permease family protein, partial [Muribaculaceae bacterium]|nr:FtsX-like permease family protein [Muribaculaceae bacterium]
PAGIVVTEEYARRVWGAVDPIGKSITRPADGESLVVTGVMEPMTNTALMTGDRRPVDMLLNIMAAESVKPDVISPTMNDATAVDIVLVAKEGHDLTARKKEYEEALKPEFWILNLPEDDVRLEVYPFNESYFSEVATQYSNVNSGDGKLLKLLFSVGLVILLFAIMNYINLTVALAGKRTKEMSTRRLLGEGRIRVMWRLIGESALLCSVSMIIGLALAFAVEPYASAILKTPLSITGCLNFTTVGFLVMVLLIMSLTSGMIPALMLSSMKPIQAVKGAFRRKSNMVYGKVFIVIQNLATITMVAGAMTMYMQVRHLIDAPLGYDTDHIMNITHKYFNLNRVKKGEMLRDELLKLPCVDEVGYCIDVPIDGGSNNTVNFDGRTISLQAFTGDSIYMDILGIKLKRDNQPERHLREYISVGALDAFGLDEDATHYPYYQSWLPIAGVFEDFKIRTVLSEQHPLIIELIDDPNYFDKVSHWSVLIKVNGDEIQALEQVKGVFERLYSGEYQDKAFEKPYLRQQIEENFEDQHRLSTIMAIFAAIAVMISMLGLTAMSTYYVRQRAQDIAVRKVMGGTSFEVLVRLVRTFMLYVVIAAVISVPVIYYVMNDWLSQFSYRIEVYWWIYAASALLAIVICFVSVVAQCSRAANANPVNALK